MTNSKDELDETKRVIDALVRMKPKPHEEINIGKKTRRPAEEAKEREITESFFRESSYRKTAAPVVRPEPPKPRGYLGPLGFLMVSTTCVLGFPCAVLTVVKRPVMALRPMRAIRIHLLSGP